MSTIFLRPNGIYYLVVKLPDGSRRWVSTKTRNRSQALRSLFEYESNPHLADRFPLLSEFIAELFPHLKCILQQGTIDIYEKSFRFFLKSISDTHINKITHRNIDRYRTERLATVSKTTLNIELRTLRAGFEHAVRWKILDTNPFKGIKLCQIDEKYPLFLAPHQYKILMQSVKELWLKQMIVVGALTGMRRNELLYLTWQNIDFENRIVYLFSKPNFRTKNGKNRVIPLNESAIRILQECFEFRNSKYVFTFTNGKPVADDHVSRMFKRYVKKLNLNFDLTFHSLRHTFASWLVQKGASLFEVQKLMGHSNPRVTEIYAHLLPHTMHRVVQSIDPNF